MVTILKLQRSLQSSDGKERVLMYNEEHTFTAEQDLTEGLRKLFGNQPKVYARAKLKKGSVAILGLVKAQPW